MVESAGEKLGEEFTKKVLSEKENLRLEFVFENFFDKCHLVNELLEEKIFYQVCLKDETCSDFSSKKALVVRLK